MNNVVWVYLDQNLLLLLAKHWYIPVFTFYRLQRSIGNYSFERKHISHIFAYKQCNFIRFYRLFLLLSFGFREDKKRSLNNTSTPMYRSIELANVIFSNFDGTPPKTKFISMSCDTRLRLNFVFFVRESADMRMSTFFYYLLELEGDLPLAIQYAYEGKWYRRKDSLQWQFFSSFFFLHIYCVLHNHISMTLSSSRSSLSLFWCVPNIFPLN